MQERKSKVLTANIILFLLIISFSVQTFNFAFNRILIILLYKLEREKERETDRQTERQRQRERKRDWFIDGHSMHVPTIRFTADRN